MREAENKQQGQREIDGNGEYQGTYGQLVFAERKLAFPGNTRYIQQVCERKAACQDSRASVIAETRATPIRLDFTERLFTVFGMLPCWSLRGRYRQGSAERASGERDYSRAAVREQIARIRPVSRIGPIALVSPQRMEAIVPPAVTAITRGQRCFGRRKASISETTPAAPSMPTHAQSSSVMPNVIYMNSISLNDCYWPSPAVQLSIAARQAEYVADCHEGPRPSRSGHQCMALRLIK